MDHRCVYRFARKGGLACGAPSRGAHAFCASHRRHASSRMFRDIDIILKGRIMTKQNVINILVEFFDEQSTRSDCVFVAIKCISYLLDLPVLKEVVTTDASAKVYIVIDIVYVAHTLHNMKHSRAISEAVSCLQRRFRDKLQRKLLGGGTAVNDICPFSLEKTSDVRTLFWSDGYTFDAEALTSSIFVYNNTTNPFTREPFSDDDIHRLKRWASVYSPKSLAIAQYTYSSPLQAFSHVSREFAAVYGIDIRPEWLTVLDVIDMQIVLDEYNGVSGYLQYIAHNPEDFAQTQYAFAREIQKLIADNNFYNAAQFLAALRIVCRFIVIPNWLRDSVA